MGKMDELRTACKGAVDYLRMNCNPHQTIIIDSDRIRLVSDDIGVPTKTQPISKEPTD